MRETILTDKIKEGLERLSGEGLMYGIPALHLHGKMAQKNGNPGAGRLRVSLPVCARKLLLNLYFCGFTFFPHIFMPLPCRG